LSFAYLAVLTFSLLGLGAIDFRSKLALFVYPLRTTLTLVLGMVFFLIWDVAGIGLGIFFMGDTSMLTGIMIAPEVPLEELFFLAVLCYTTLLIWLGLSRRASREGDPK
jgi:lycopene cyclase domain-containing protein